MKRLSLIIAVVILFIASSCAPSYMCPTYTHVETPQEASEAIDQNNL